MDPWPGYKSGALNLALSDYTHPDAEIIGVIDSDYLVDPTWLKETVGYFSDPNLAFVQTPQDYRDFEGSTYLTACYDAYRYFFATAMPSRNERNSIIFAGTMGLLREASSVRSTAGTSGALPRTPTPHSDFSGPAIPVCSSARVSAAASCP